MGNATARDLATSGIDLDTALRVHLRSNHYPPIHLDFLPIARQAIELAQGEEWDAELEYPNGLVRTVAHTVEGLHLDAFIEQDHEHWYDETGVPGYTECECGSTRKFDRETQTYVYDN